MHTNKEHQQVANQLRGVANERRIHLMFRLAQGPLCLRDVAAYLGIQPQNASKHVRRLITAGFVEGRRRGKTVEFFLKKKACHSTVLWRVLKNGMF